MAQTELLLMEKVCDYCGAKLEISSVARHGDPHPYHYACGQCGKGYEISSFAPPHVRVLAPRTDGKSDSYQQTMF
ncbi:MAG TPA: hypothetical protein VMZ74_11200 [Ramlibacter sp.]|nr:hypothetical protein [Ramlibacter sp.]